MEQSSAALLRDLFYCYEIIFPDKMTKKKENNAYYQCITDNTVDSSLVEQFRI